MATIKIKGLEHQLLVDREGLYYINLQGQDEVDPGQGPVTVFPYTSLHVPTASRFRNRVAVVGVSTARASLCFLELLNLWNSQLPEFWQFWS